MKHLLISAFFIMLCISSRIVYATETLTDEVNDMIETMIRDHQPAFLSTCRVMVGTENKMAAIIFSPVTNKGLFVFADDQRKVTNDAPLSWSDSGEWNMSELEGGIATIKIMSDLLTQLAHKTFEWTSPATLKNAWLKAPANSCKLLRMQ